MKKLLQSFIFRFDHRQPLQELQEAVNDREIFLKELQLRNQQGKLNNTNNLLTV